jgi:ribonuclease HI
MGVSETLESRLISLFCDGSAHAKPGYPGGWAFVIVREGEVLRSGTGGARRTTNNRMEMTAAIEGLKAWLDLGLDSPLELVSDSRHSLDIASGAHLPRKDSELVSELHRLAQQAKVTCRWVAGHSGNEWNERCDRLAHEAKQSFVPARIRKKQTKTRTKPKQKPEPKRSP